MTAKRDYYEVLGVSKDTPINEIKSQYRKLALKFHPDRNKSEEAAEHFKEISEAYAVISDPEKRKIYDQHGHAGVDGRYSTDDIFQGASANFNDIFGRGGGGFDSIFESIFGRGGGFGGQQQRGSDLLYETSISLEDVLSGKKMEIDLKKNIECTTCNGSGCKPGTSQKTCNSCNGQGQVRKSRSMGFASFVTVEPCSSCRGKGSIVETPCSECKGNGKSKGTKKITFEIPPGIDNGDYTIPNEGDEIPGGINGDLIVRIRVIDATLGKEITVPILNGSDKIRIDSGSQPNTIIKLKGKGLPRLNSRGRGDQYVRVVVNIPKKLSKDQKKLLEEFQNSLE
jgi:molecular chaperone DnaJ